MTTLDQTKSNSTVSFEKVDDISMAPEAVELTPIERKMADTLRGLVIDCSAVSYVDLMGSVAMRELWEEFGAIGVSVVFANCPGENLKLNWTPAVTYIYTQFKIR